MNCTNCGSALSAPAGYCGTCGQPTSSPTAPAWQSDATSQFAAAPHAEPYTAPSAPAPYAPSAPAPYAPPVPTPYAPPAVAARGMTGNIGNGGLGEPSLQPTYGQPPATPPRDQPVSSAPPYGQPISPAPQAYGQPVSPAPQPYGQPPPSPYGPSAPLPYGPPASYGQLSGPPPIQPYPGQPYPGQPMPYGPGPGQPPYQVGYPDGPVIQQPTNRLSIIAFILAGLALFVLPIIVGVAGIALGAAAKRREEPLGKASMIVAVAATALSLTVGFILRVHLR